MASHKLSDIIGLQYLTEVLLTPHSRDHNYMSDFVRSDINVLSVIKLHYLLHCSHLLTLTTCGALQCVPVVMTLWHYDIVTL